MKPDFSDPIKSTRTGRFVNLIDPDPNDIVLRDIIWALSNQCRYDGHCSVFYSVAEHSVRVAQYLRRCGYSPSSQLAGLLHDATEAYLGDVCTPLKSIMPQYKAIEANFESVIEKRFGVTIHGRPEIKDADVVLLAYEKMKIMPQDKEEWPILIGVDPLAYDMVKKNKKTSTLGWPPETARQMFERAFYHITSEIPNYPYREVL